MSETFEGRTYIIRMANKRTCSVCGAEEPTVLFDVTRFGDAVPVKLEARPFGITECVNGPHLIDAPPRPPRETVPEIATETPKRKRWWQV